MRRKGKQETKAVFILPIAGRLVFRSHDKLNTTELSKLITNITFFFYEVGNQVYECECVWCSIIAARRQYKD